MADVNELEAQLRRLAAIVAPLAETANQHDARMAVLEAIVVRLDATVQRLDQAIDRIDRTLAQQGTFNADVRTTLVRLETIITHLGQQSENGRDA